MARGTHRVLTPPHPHPGPTQPYQVLAIGGDGHAETWVLWPGVTPQEAMAAQGSHEFPSLSTLPGTKGRQMLLGLG